MEQRRRQLLQRNENYLEIGKSIVIDRLQFWTIFYSEALEGRQAWKGLWSNCRQIWHATEAQQFQFRHRWKPVWMAWADYLNRIFIQVEGLERRCFLEGAWRRC